MYRNLILPVIFSLSIISACPLFAQNGDRIEIGDICPSFYLRDINGNNFFLSECVGEKATGNYEGIIFSFCASYCEPCKKEIPELEKLLEIYKDRGLGVYLVALEKKDTSLFRSF